MMRNCLHVIMPAPNFANSPTPRIYFSDIDKKNYVPYARQKVIGIG